MGKRVGKCFLIYNFPLTFSPNDKNLVLKPEVYWVASLQTDFKVWGVKFILKRERFLLLLHV